MEPTDTTRIPAAHILTGIQLPTDVTLNERDLCDLEMLLMGAFAPLSGYLNFKNFCSVVETSRLTNGVLWPIPIILPIPKKHISISNTNITTTISHTIKLRNIVGTVLAEVDVEDCYGINIRIMAKGVLGCYDENHPYIQYLQEQGDVIYIGGNVRGIHPIQHFDFTDFRRTPKQIKDTIKKKGWEIIVGFQTRNPMHRSHFELTRQALEDITRSDTTNNKSAHLLLTPACGPTQPGDIDYHVRVRCYKKILPYYKELCQEEADLVLLPLAMRMAGPREALWHALIRKNYGCTHFIVGRDHAGPSSKKKDGSLFYQPYEAHDLLKSMEKEIGIIPIFGRNLLYLGEENGGYVPEDKVPNHVTALQISGTKFRQMLIDRIPIPEWYSFTPVIQELQQYYKQNHRLGFCLYFTGLPCSGKTTLTKAVEACLLERESEHRHITILDADIIRTHLSKGLGFDREARSVNVRRIGYAASLVVQHEGICIVANIAPYEEDRQFNRELITATGGGYIEIYVSTPLEVCEERDVKGLYKKARLGIVQQFTGISDPYEIPKKPELVLNSSEDLLGKVQTIINYLIANKWII